MTKMNSIKASPLGQDLLDALWDKQRNGILDVYKSIITLREYLVKDLSPSDLKYLYSVYFDAARVLMAECVAEFFQAGRICITAFDPLRMRHESRKIRQIIITPEDVSRLLQVLHRVKEPAHDLYQKHGGKSWAEHIETLCKAVSKLQ
ncbi:hypothetical protein AALD01_05130 [Oscillospiraceae bacterium 21-37]